MKDQAKDQQCLRLYDELLPRMFDYPDKWARERAGELAFIEYDTGEEQTWKDFALKSNTRSSAKASWPSSSSPTAPSCRSTS